MSSLSPLMNQGPINFFFFFFYYFWSEILFDGIIKLGFFFLFWGWVGCDQMQCGKWIWVQMQQWKQVRTLNDQEKQIVLITLELVFVDLALLVGSIILVIGNWYDFCFFFIWSCLWFWSLKDLFGWIKISKLWSCFDLFSLIIQFLGDRHCKDERRIPWKDWSAWMRGYLSFVYIID